jgi:hypothetical protein
MFDIYSPIYFVTLIPADLLVTPAGLQDLDIKKPKNRFAVQFRRTTLKDSLIIGGIEPVYIPDSNLMQVHAHLIVAGASYEDIDELRRFYPDNWAMQIKEIWPKWPDFLDVWRDSRRCGEPTDVRFRRLGRQIDRNRMKSISYTLKNVTGFKPKNSSFYRPAPVEIEVAHLLWLDKGSFEERIILKGIRLAQNNLVTIQERNIGSL